MSKGDRIDPEMKAMIAREVVDKKRRPEDVAREYSYSVDTTRRWVQKYRGNPCSPSFTKHATPDSDEARELAQLKKQVKQLEEENAFLQRVSTYFANRPKSTC